MFRLVLITLISCSLTFADTIYLAKDTPAPFEGLLFPTAQANQIRQQLIERDGLLLINTSLQKSLDLSTQIDTSNNKKINLLIEQNDKLASSLSEERTMSNWERVGYFVGGIVVVGLAFYGLGQIHK